jgi:hypothetical protein
VIDPALDVTLRAGLSLLLATAAWHKLRDVAGFEATLRDYRLLPDATCAAAARGFPGLESLLAVGLWLPALRSATALATGALLALYGVAIAVNLARGRRHIDCGCSGPATRQSLHEWLLLRNALLVVAAGICAMPATARPLGWLDVPGIVGALATGTLLYGAANLLAAALPRTRRLQGLS